MSSWMNHHKLFRSEYDRRICELNKYATAYQDKENAIWEATLNVATTTNGEKTLYDINPIRMVEQPVKSGTISTNNRVSQSNSTVNAQSMQNNKKNIQGGSNSMCRTQHLHQNAPYSSEYGAFISSK